jgi:hypothetical protein
MSVHELAPVQRVCGHPRLTTSLLGTAPFPSRHTHIRRHPPTCRYDHHERISAAEALQHPFFAPEREALAQAQAQAQAVAQDQAGP